MLFRKGIYTFNVGLFVEPNTPGKFIVWFRNETTLLVLWQPPYPAGIYTHYKVSIDPADAIESVLYVEKEGEPPGPAQAAFKGLVPGQLLASRNHMHILWNYYTNQIRQSLFVNILHFVRKLERKLYFKLQTNKFHVIWTLKSNRFHFLFLDIRNGATRSKIKVKSK